MYKGKYTNPQSAEKKSFAQWLKKYSKGTIVFYSIYIAFILLFFIVLACLLAPLRDWLIRYEASQPEGKRDEVFSQLFEDPDWEQIYTLAGINDTTFENKSSYAAYMENLVGDQELICLETSAGLSGNKKYIVKLGDQKIASFLLVNGAENKADIPKWELGPVEVFFSGSQSVLVEKLPGQTVYINGVALNDSFTVRIIRTAADKYLDAGLSGYCMEQQLVTGLLTQPQVTVKAPNGQDVPVTFDAQRGVYVVENLLPEASAEEKELALNAVQAYAKYMIKKVSLTEIAKLFDTSSSIYKTIAGSEVGWMQSYASFSFTAAQYSSYYRYSDNLFSIYVDTTLNVVRYNGSVKEYPLGNTLFFQKNSNGKWLVTEMTNVDVQQRQEQVRLCFQDQDGTVLEDRFVDNNVQMLTLPTVTVPDGMTFRGWVREDTDDKGNTTLTVVFDSSVGTEVYLPQDYTLEPMVLKALFEEVKES